MINVFYIKEITPQKFWNLLILFRHECLFRIRDQSTLIIPKKITLTWPDWDLHQNATTMMTREYNAILYHTLLIFGFLALFNTNQRSRRTRSKWFLNIWLCASCGKGPESDQLDEKIEKKTDYTLLLLRNSPFYIICIFQQEPSATYINQWMLFYVTAFFAGIPSTFSNNKFAHVRILTR